MTKKFSRIREAQILAEYVRSSTNFDTFQKVQKLTGKTIIEVAELLGEEFNNRITPEDYDEWIRQVVMHAEAMKRDGNAINLNKRSTFDDLLGEILENDPANKMSFDNDDDGQLSKHVYDAVWKRYQGTRDHLKAQNVMQAREEEEYLRRASQRRQEDEEFNANRPPAPEETERFRPMSGAERYDDDDISYRDDDDDYDTDMDDTAADLNDARDDMEHDDMEHDDMEHDDMEHDDMEHDDMEHDEIPMECPYDEGTPECDAWMAGYEAARNEDGGNEDDMGSDMDDEMEGPDMDDEYQGRGDEEDFGNAPIDIEREENEERIYRYNPKTVSNHEQKSLLDAGYKAASADYHQGNGRRSPVPALSKSAQSMWERGYDSFMKDTEGQRDLGRHGGGVGQRSDTPRGHGTENEEVQKKDLQSIITRPRTTLNNALKGVESEGAKAFIASKLAQNPHPHKSLAHISWSKGFKNAVKSAFGFDKPHTEKNKPKKKKK
jgi:hypothetical protein